MAEEQQQQQHQVPKTVLFHDPKIVEINKKIRTIWALSSAGALLGWDLEVNMPERGSVSRGIAAAELELLRQEHMKGVYPLLDEAEQGSRNLNDYEKGVLRVLRRAQKFFTRIPPSLIEEDQRLAVEGTVIWREARKKSSFRQFEPLLEKIVDLKIREAEKLGYEKEPYDALLDLFEEGVTSEDMNSIFSTLIPGLKRILSRTRPEFLARSPLVETAYDREPMAKLDEKITEILKMPKDRFRMDVSTHPFMTSMSRDDVRITTRYEGKDFRSSMYSVMHESGHAIYELQLQESMEYTPIGNPVSSGFHESQSRFWENVIGRSRAFVSLAEPTIRENLSFVSGYDNEKLYAYFNSVRPGFIRVDADELTYNFHTALRFELERKILSGKIKASELPSLWNEKMEEYLGIVPRNDAEGVLQDVHWSGGMFGYFPTYSLGNILAGMIWYNIRKDVDLGEKVRAGEFSPIKEWLYEKIHRWGSTFPPKELARRSFGESYNPERLLQYLEEKYV